MKNESKTEEDYLNQIKSEPRLFEKLPIELRDNKEFIIKAIEILPHHYHYHFRRISEELRDDKDVMLKLVEKHADSMCYASRRLMKDYEVALTCLKHKEGTLEHLHFDLIDELKENKATNKEQAIKYLELVILKENLQTELSNNNTQIKKPKI